MIPEQVSDADRAPRLIAVEDAFGIPGIVESSPTIEAVAEAGPETSFFAGSDPAG